LVINFIQLAVISTNIKRHDEANVCLIYLNKRVVVQQEVKSVQVHRYYTSAVLWNNFEPIKYSRWRDPENQQILQSGKKCPVKISCDLGRKVPVQFLLEYWNKICPLNFLSCKEPVPLKFSVS